MDTNSHVHIKPEIIEKQHKLGILRINGKSFTLLGLPAEYNIEMRKRWIEKQLQLQTQIKVGVEVDVNEINRLIDISQFWYYYVTMGCTYSHISKETYCEWEKDRNAFLNRKK